MAVLLYREHELAFRTQYAEIKDRVQAQGALLPGTPGSLALRTGTGYGYWYRVFYPVPGKQAEEMVCRGDDLEALNAMRERIEFAAWVSSQVSALRRLGFQVADKATSRVLVQLHNCRAFEPGLILVGTLAYMALLNEAGAAVVSARTLDVDLALPSLKFAAGLRFLESMRATSLPFVPVPGVDASEPATSVELPGGQGLRVDVLAPGAHLGEVVRVPDLEWAAQTVPFYDYLLEEPEPAAVLAGNHCVPVRVPQATRFVWHKLYSSTQRRGFAEKAEKDRRQALVLGAVLADDDPDGFERAMRAAPARMLAPIRPWVERLMKRADCSPALRDLLQRFAR